MTAQRVFISVGSNLGDRIANCRKAIELVGGRKDTTVVKKSSFYETEPWGKADQGPFINSVIEVITSLGPDDLLEALKSIEALMGRKPAERWGPRLIDLDIIFYGDRVIEKEGLTIPHPLAHLRSFVLIPLRELAPDFIHPALNTKISDLADAIPQSGVKKLDIGSK